MVLKNFLLYKKNGHSVNDFLSSEDITDFLMIATFDVSVSASDFRCANPTVFALLHHHLSLHLHPSSQCLLPTRTLTLLKPVPTAIHMHSLSVEQLAVTVV
jgi:hypothetical protein